MKNTIAFAVFAAAAIAAPFAAHALEMAEPENVPPLLAPGMGQNNVKAWQETRRPQIKKILEEEVYGIRPVERPPHLVFTEIEPRSDAFDGTAVRRKIRVEYGGKYGTNSFTFVAFVPKAEKPLPSFVLVASRPPEVYLDESETWAGGRWPIRMVVERGYAAIAFHKEEVAPDKFHGNTRGVFAAFEDVEKSYRSYTSWGALSAWGWAASRVLDWIETEPSLDAKRVAVIGHSRGGKTALVAAAWDERFAMAVSSCSGAGGAKLRHVDLPSSEQIADSVRAREFWYCRRYVHWVNRDKQVPFDQHWLVAMIAPRPVCIGSATDDDGAGPYGEYQTARYASQAWRLYGKKGFVSDGFPEPDTPQQEGDISYHVRTGGHGLTAEDWKVYLDFADKRMKGER